MWIDILLWSIRDAFFINCENETFGFLSRGGGVGAMFIGLLDFSFIRVVSLGFSDALGLVSFLGGCPFFARASASFRSRSAFRAALSFATTGSIGFSGPLDGDLRSCEGG